MNAIYFNESVINFENLAYIVKQDEKKNFKILFIFNSQANLAVNFESKLDRDAKYQELIKALGFKIGGE